MNILNVGILKGRRLFFLPPYSPQMNRIEDEWLHLKRSGTCKQGIRG